MCGWVCALEYRQRRQTDHSEGEKNVRGKKISGSSLSHLLNRMVEHIFNRVVDSDDNEAAESEDDAERQQRLNQVFQALADPTRRKIIELLREAGELRVGDIANAFSMSLNGVSKHLKALERADLVLRRKDGRAHWLRVHWHALQSAYEWLHFHRHYWSARLDALADYVLEQTTAKPDRSENTDE